MGGTARSRLCIKVCSREASRLRSTICESEHMSYASQLYRAQVALEKAAADVARLTPLADAEAAANKLESGQAVFVLAGRLTAQTQPRIAGGVVQGFKENTGTKGPKRMVVVLVGSGASVEIASVPDSAVFPTYDAADAALQARIKAAADSPASPAPEAS